MDIKELRGKSKNERIKLLATSREELRKLRFDVAAHTGKKNIRALRDLKKRIARLLTIEKSEQHTTSAKEEKVHPSV